MAEQELRKAKNQRFEHQNQFWILFCPLFGLKAPSPAPQCHWALLYCNMMTKIAHFKSFGNSSGPKWVIGVKIALQHLGMPCTQCTLSAKFCMSANTQTLVLAPWGST